MKKTNKHYVSDIDKQLKAFNDTQPKSAAQQAEIAKYQRIYQLRDNPIEEPTPDDSLWD